MQPVADIAGRVWSLGMPPAFESEELNQRARVFHRVMLSIMLVATPLLLTVALVDPPLLGRVSIAFVGVNGIGAVLLLINRRGRSREAAIGLIAGLMLLTTGLSLTAGGIRSTGVTMHFLFVLGAGVLLGQRAAIVAAVASALIGIVLVVVERAGGLIAPLPPYGPVVLLLFHTMYLAVALAMLRFATGSVSGALSRAERELAQRKTAEEEQRRLVGRLGERVKELRVLHEASSLLRDRPFDRTVLADLARLLPAGWQHPEVAEALVAFDDMTETSPGWRETPWRLEVPFATSQGAGRVSVAYTQSRPAADEGPFLREERALLNSFSEILVAYLERHVAERRRRATEHQLRQSQKMEALGTLAGGIAHDFNNILTAIVANVEVARLDLDEHHPVRPSVDAINDAAARATDIVRRILLFSRRQESEHRTIPLGPVVEEALRLVRISLPKGISVTTRFAQGLPAVSGDASQLYQVFMNLLTNAGHAMQASGGTLTVGLEVVELDASNLPTLQLTPGRYLRVTVADTGIGMSPATLERIFEPFFTTKGHVGTGLGLSVVHGIVEDHGGAITVASTLGAGTTFDVWLPAVTTAASAPTAAVAPPTGHGEHILLVDDEESIAMAMERVIARLGYHCTAVVDPVAALEMLRAQPQAYAAVITDLSMPGMNGLRFAAEVRAIRPGMPIAIASGYGESAAEAVARGEVNLRIHKPASLDELATMLRELVRAR